VNGPNVSATIASSACNLPVNFSGSTTSTNITNWSWNFGDAQGSNMQNAQHTYTVGVATTFTVTVTVTDANGCMATATGSITVSPPPPPFNLIYTSPGCGNVLLDAGGGYTSYQWFMNGTSISGATNQTHSATTSGNYYAEVIDGNGCLIQSNQASIIVNPLPALNLTASPQPLCSNQAITLNSGLSGNYFVEWKDGGFNPLGTGLTYAAGILPAGSYTFNVVATDLSTFCKAVAAITITVNPAPSVTISNSNPSGICAPNPVTLTATGSPAAVTYSWSTGATSPVINVFSGGIYTVTATDPANGCMASAFNNVIIFPLPDLSLLPIGL
jgi:PKD repeat protein